jgi:hypothetical protein
VVSWEDENPRLVDRKDLLHGIEGMSMAIQTRGPGLSFKEVESDLAHVKKDLLSNKIHADFQM